MKCLRIVPAMKYNEALSKGRNILENSGIKDGKTDAFLLISYVTNKDRTFFLTYGDSEELGSAEEKEYLSLIKKRASHIPLQLLTGETDFMGLRFFVSKDVLIPRIDTEFLVEEALIRINDGADVLDMCTGSGCILLSLMKYKNGINGVGADISDHALNLAKKNAESLGISNVRFVNSDLFADVHGKYDHILCNPPYIKSREIDTLMEEVRLHEPVNALDGGEDGLEFYRRIAEGARDHLVNGGSMMFEIGYDQGEEVPEILREAGYGHIEVLKDYSGNERVVRCLKS